MPSRRDLERMKAQPGLLPLDPSNHSLVLESINRILADHFAFKIIDAPNKFNGEMTVGMLSAVLAERLYAASSHFVPSHMALIEGAMRRSGFTVPWWRHFDDVIPRTKRKQAWSNISAACGGGLPRMGVQRNARLLIACLTPAIALVLTFAIALFAAVNIAPASLVSVFGGPAEYGLAFVVSVLSLSVLLRFVFSGFHPGFPKRFDTPAKFGQRLAEKWVGLYKPSEWTDEVVLLQVQSAISSLLHIRPEEVSPDTRMGDLKSAHAGGLPLEMKTA
jgi:hypothetical protein